MRFPINPRYHAKKLHTGHWSVYDMHTGDTANVNGIILGKLDKGMAIDLANTLNPTVPSR